MTHVRNLRLCRSEVYCFCAVLILQSSLEQARGEMEHRLTSSMVPFFSQPKDKARHLQCVAMRTSLPTIMLRVGDTSISSMFPPVDIDLLQRSTDKEKDPT